jgi:uncharacterized protein (DUF433 family)
MKEISPRITVDKDTCGGRPVIQGTRVPVELVIGELGGGLSVEEVCKAYRLEREDVLAALSYAAQTLAQDEVRALP